MGVGAAKRSRRERHTMGKRILTDVKQWPELKFFADAMVVERKARKISQKDLADRTGLTQAYISSLEKYYANPTIQVQATIARAIGVSLTTLTLTRRVRIDATNKPIEPTPAEQQREARQLGADVAKAEDDDAGSDEDDTGSDEDDTGPEGTQH